MACELLLRFVVGGAVVSAFAMIGDLFKPKTFAGLFGAAPSVALATIALTILSHGRAYAAIEARSMLAGTAAFLAYACVVQKMLMPGRLSAKRATLTALPLWLAIAFLLWGAFLRS